MLPRGRPGSLRLRAAAEPDSAVAYRRARPPRPGPARAGGIGVRPLRG